MKECESDNVYLLAYTYIDIMEITNLYIEKASTKKNRRLKRFYIIKE